MKLIKVGSDFSGVGAFDYAIERVAKQKNFEKETIFACDWDKYARITYLHNHGRPKYYPKDVYERKIPKESLDIYMTSPPCQSFSLAGKREGKNSDKGILFFNSHEFIQKNNPRFFIFENVKGLLSDDEGRTFQEWINMLGGKSVNGLPVIFPYDNSVPYHLYWKVLNSKKHGVPQNRERVFLVGIRDDVDNQFQFPKEEYLTKRLKDVLEKEFEIKYILSEKMVEKITLDNKGNGEVANLNKGGERGSVYCENGDSMSCLSATDYKQPKQIMTNLSKYYLSEKMVKMFSVHNDKHKSKGTGFIHIPKSANDIANCLRANAAICPTDNTLQLEGLYIRRLTPRECFRLQDFPDTFDFSCVSDSQAYKQAGNSITVRVLEKILLKMNL